MKKLALSLFTMLCCCCSILAQSQTIENLHKQNSQGLSLRTNVLSWGVLTPSLGVEYRLNEDWGLLVDGAYARWDWKNKAKRHRIWQVNPQVRHYFSEGKDTYLGIEYSVGQYSLNWGGTGREADYMGGG